MVIFSRARGDRLARRGRKSGIFTTTERRGRHEIEQSQIGPKVEGVGTSESKHTEEEHTEEEHRRGKRNRGSRGGAEARRGMNRKFGKTARE